MSDDNNDVLRSMVVMELMAQDVILDLGSSVISLLVRVLWNVDTVRAAMLRQDYDAADDEVKRLLQDRRTLLAAV